MTCPRVTEMPLRLEPVSDDTFIDRQSPPSPAWTGSSPTATNAAEPLLTAARPHP
jgi:hypothetical protein